MIGSRILRTGRSGATDRDHPIEIRVVPTKNPLVLLAPYSAEYGAIFSSILRQPAEFLRSVSAPKLYHAQVHLSRVFSAFL